MAYFTETDFWRFEPVQTCNNFETTLASLKIIKIININVIMTYFSSYCSPKTTNFTKSALQTSQVIVQ